MEAYDSHNLSGPSRNLESNQMLDEFDESHPVAFYEMIPSLKSIASYVVAIECWRKYLNNQNLERSSYSKDLGSLRFWSVVDERKVIEILNNLPIPRSICDMIEDNYLNSVRREMDRWACYYEREVFHTPFQLQQEIEVLDLMFCHWLPNGTIDDRKSALNMLSNPRMTLAHKFAIASKYCFEDVIKKLPIESIPVDLIQKISFNEEPLLFYWLCILHNVPDKLFVENEERVEAFMITASSTDNWSAIEYFWDRLTTEEQTSKLKELLNRKFEFQKRLIYKMTNLQKKCIFREIPGKIFSNFLYEPGQEYLALSTWIYIQNFMNCKQFEEMWVELLKVVDVDTDSGIDCLMYIWNNCPNHLKKLAFQPPIMNRILRYLTRQLESYAHSADINTEFLTLYLSEGNAELRKKFIFQGAQLFVSLAIRNEYETDQLVKLCLPNATDVLKFKKCILESKDIQEFVFSITLHNSEFEYFNSFLDFYCWDSNSRTKFCCDVIEEYFEEFEWYKMQDWIDFIEVIDDNLLLTLPDKALDFKKRTTLHLVEYFHKLQHNNGSIPKNMKIVSQIFNAEELRKLKPMVLEGLQSNHLWNEFDENIVSGFLLWCCNNDRRKMEKFKKTLPIDDIFFEAWRYVNYSTPLHDVDEDMWHELLAPLDKLLLWFFESADIVKKFKLEKVSEYCDTCSLKGWAYRQEDVLARAMLLWFFEGDQDAVQSFKEKHN